MAGDPSYAAECELRFEELELVVVGDPTRPHDFMDGARLTLNDSALGSALRLRGDSGYRLAVATTIAAETRSAASRSEYSADLTAWLGSTLELDGLLER